MSTRSSHLRRSSTAGGRAAAFHATRWRGRGLRLAAPREAGLPAPGARPEPLTAEAAYADLAGHWTGQCARSARPPSEESGRARAPGARGFAVRIGLRRCRGSREDVPQRPGGLQRHRRQCGSDSEMSTASAAENPREARYRDSLSRFLDKTFRRELPRPREPRRRPDGEAEPAERCGRRQCFQACFDAPQSRLHKAEPLAVQTVLCRPLNCEASRGISGRALRCQRPAESSMHCRGIPLSGGRRHRGRPW
jgi:hypothetical protein